MSDIRANRKKPPRRLIISDLSFDGTPRCGQCGHVLPSSTPVNFEGEYVMAQCQRQDCLGMTPFRRTA
jgi:hypothetical protein